MNRRLPAFRTHRLDFLWDFFVFASINEYQWVWRYHTLLHDFKDTRCFERSWVAGHCWNHTVSLIRSLIRIFPLLTFSRVLITDFSTRRLDTTTKCFQNALSSSRPLFPTIFYKVIEQLIFENGKREIIGLCDTITTRTAANGKESRGA